MSRDAKVSFDWADGHYTFRLGIKQLEELQEKCDAGPGHILGRIQQGIYGDWRVKDMRETLRLGLIGGGGVTPIKVLTLLERYFDNRPLAENLEPALKVIAAAVVGHEDEPLGEAEAASDQTNLPFQEASSASPLSTEAEP